MGALQSSCSRGLEKLLMPNAGSRTQDFAGFPEAEPDSLLLIGGIKLGDIKEEHARKFYVDCIGAKLSKRPSGELRVTAGSSELVFSPQVQNETTDMEAWPGQAYLWVEDIQRVWTACKDMSATLGYQIVETEMCCKDERNVDALVLRDPAGAMLVVNQAPKGFPNKGGSNLISVMDVLRLVPPGSAAGLSRFYKQYLSAGCSLTPDGLKVHFAEGDTLRQTFTFQENDSAPKPTDSTSNAVHQVCIYMPSSTKFQLAFVKLNRAGVIEAPQSWPAAESAREFKFRRCVDPSSGGSVLDLEHVVRSPEHPDCPCNHHGADNPSLGA